MKYSFRSTALGFACLACAALSPAAITVNGVSDEQVVATAATVTVPSESGFLIEADLNGEPIALDTPVRVDQPGYYELHATKVPDGGGAGESRTVKFIIRNTDRGNSEWGLESWVPTQAIDSAPAEFAGASFSVMAPAAFPQGLPIPVIARLKNEDGSGRRVNGHAFAPELPGVPLRLRRGWGGELLAAADQGGAFLASWELNGLSAPIEIAIDESTVWQEVSGDLGGDADWGENARIHITGDLTIPAGATLTVGAGTVVQIAPGADIDVIGALQIDGTKAEPCVFCPEAGGAAWGGFLCEAGTARVNATAAIFTGAGADGSWFSGSGYHSHRREQATFIFADGAQGEFTDCAILKQPGQSLHGDNATLTLRGCLIKNVPTVGQFNGGAVSVNDSALIEFPDAESWFSDDDNDGIYFTEGGHELIDTVVGWAKDDGVDAGSGDSGTVTVSNCWFEACFHEGMAWSGGGRSIDVSDTVAINCGQGLEAGWSDGSGTSPDVVANRVLAVGNLIGWRFGDNYDWDYYGNLRIRDSLSLHNARNIWGMEWDSWTYRTDAMDIEQNKLSAAEPLFPDNTVFDPGSDAALLEPFMAVAGTDVGAGLAVYETQRDLADYGEALPAGLSTFASAPASFSYTAYAKAAGGGEAAIGSGSIAFQPGEIRRYFTPPALPAGEFDYVRIALSDPQGCALSGPGQLVYVSTPGESDLVVSGAQWRYLDDGSNQGTAWRENGFDDSGWAAGGSQLGYGDDDEETEVGFVGGSNNKNATTYFRHTFTVANPAQFSSLTLRLTYDDGAIAYLNGTEVALTSNMSSGMAFDEFSDGDSPSDNAVATFDLSPAALVAGDNVLAVEIHQGDGGSSDISMDAELTGTIGAGINLWLAQDGDGASAIWSGDGAVLEFTPRLGEPWAPVPNAQSPLPVWPPPAGSPLRGEPSGFFRLRR